MSTSDDISTSVDDSMFEAATTTTSASKAKRRVFDMAREGEKV
jgi:hypothetical protein